MTRYGRKPPAIERPRTHARGCRCPFCDRNLRAEAEAERLRERAAQEAAGRLVRINEARAAAKVEAGREQIRREELDANDSIERIRAARNAADADPKAARLRELRAEGKTLAEAFAIIEAEGEPGS